MKKQQNNTVPKPVPWPVRFFAHRGVLKENTVESFAKAAGVGIPGVEMDIWALGNELKIGHGKYTAKKAGAPLLRNVLDAIAERAVLWRPVVNIELKSRGTAELLLTLLNQYRDDRKWRFTDFIISAFIENEKSQEETELIHEMEYLSKNADIPLAVLTRFSGNIQRHLELAKNLRACSIHLKLREINRSYVDRVHRNNCTVYVWTVKKRNDLVKLAGTGVDGVFIDSVDSILGYTFSE